MRGKRGDLDRDYVRPADEAQQAIVNQSPKNIDCSNSGLEELRSWVVAMFIQQKQEFESFGDFCHRVGADAITAFAESYTLGSIKA